MERKTMAQKKKFPYKNSIKLFLLGKTRNIKDENAE